MDELNITGDLARIFAERQKRSCESLTSAEAPERVFCRVTRWMDGYIAVEGVDDGCSGIEYIRADIAKRERSQAIEAAGPVWLNIAPVEAAALLAEITRLENIIAGMSAREVDAAQARDETLKEILEWVPECTCDGAYLSRGLIAPDCLYHSSGMEEVEEIVRGLLAAEEKGDG